MRVVVTGGYGFIGSHVVRWLLQHVPSVEVVNLDVLTYAGNPANLADVAEDPRYRWLRVSVSDYAGVYPLFQSHPIDAVIHLAAESHVDRSIETGLPFVQTNVMGTEVLLEIARKTGVGRFLQVSTDEVYGSLGSDGLFRETDPVRPNSPYAASKAAADLLVQAAHRTYGQNVVITRCSNNFGPYQFPEKLIPLWITNALEGKPWPIYGDGQNVRDWLYVEDHVEALWLALTRGQAGEIYNIGGHNEKTNWDVADALLSRLGLTRSVVVPVPDRAGHDRRYALDATKAEQELGWRPRHDWETALTATVVWYQTHREWWQSIKQGTYQDDYRRRYPTLAVPQGD